MADDTTIDDTTNRQQAAIIALLSAPTLRDASKKSGIPERTIYTWMKSDTAFQSAYRQARRDSVQVAIGRLQRISADAVETIKAIMKSEESNASVRLAAAKTILDFALRSTEIDDLESRISALESAHETAL